MQDQEITIEDAIRGNVTWNTNTLGDFVVLRSNGLPVYNFCVAVDDALMGITHVIRAEEHLPNTFASGPHLQSAGLPHSNLRPRLAPSLRRTKASSQSGKLEYWLREMYTSTARCRFRLPLRPAMASKL